MNCCSPEEEIGFHAWIGRLNQNFLSQVGSDIHILPFLDMGGMADDQQSEILVFSGNCTSQGISDQGTLIDHEGLVCH